MLKSIHFLLTCECNFECDHCFCFARPGAGGTFRIDQIEAVLEEALVLGIDSVWFEGGEPMLFFPLLVEGVRQARRRGIGSAVVTNGYWATAERDVELWLRPLADLGVTAIGVSDDALHYGEGAGPRGVRVEAVARRLGMTAIPMRTEPPRVEETPEGPVVRGDVMFRGRAAERLTAGLPVRPFDVFTRCVREDLADPERVHVDAFGNVHLCQGLSMGNLWRRPLSEIVRTWDGTAHPVAGPLLRGGPAELVRVHGLPHEPAGVDECHVCFLARRALVDRYPDLLAPRPMYGLPQGAGRTFVAGGAAAARAGPRPDPGGWPRPTPEQPPG